MMGLNLDRVRQVRFERDCSLAEARKIVEYETMERAIQNLNPQAAAYHMQLVQILSTMATRIYLS